MLAKQSPTRKVLDMDNAPYHVYPLNDLREHVVDEQLSCWCRPIDDDGVIVHNAMDQREAYEQGRKPS